MSYFLRDHSRRKTKGVLDFMAVICLKRIYPKRVLDSGQPRRHMEIHVNLSIYRGWGL